MHPSNILSNPIKKLLLLFLLLPAMLTLRAADYGIPSGIQEGNMLHCFDWKHTDIIAELPAIAQAGFGAIQISPMERPIKANVIWYDVYRPYDHKLIDNDMGTRQTLKQLCDEAAKYGIKIIVDVVGNHIDAHGPHDSWWDTNDRQRSSPPGGINYNNRTQITTYQMGDYGDVNTENSDVQQRMKDYLADLKSLGVAGIRWDATKHIGLPSENSQYWPTVLNNSGLYHYGEILDSPGGNNADNLMKEYAGLLCVTDDGASSTLRRSAAGGTFPSSFGNWVNRGIAANRIVYWGESHDTYANANGETQKTDQNIIDRAWALVSARQGESSLYFSRPPANSVGSILIGQKGSTHFTAPEVASVNKLRNLAGNAAERYVRSSDNYAAMIARQGIGAVIVCSKGHEGSVSLGNADEFIPAGSYVDLVSGNAFTVTSTGIRGSVGSTGIAVIMQTTEPILTFDPAPGTVFRTETLDITVRAANFTSASVTYNGTTTRLNTNRPTATITIGEGVEPGTDITLTWSLTNDGTTTGRATYSKRIPADNVYVWYDNPNGWSDVCIHYYGTPGGTTWPGERMTYDTALGLWYFLLPAEYAENCQFIVNGLPANSSDRAQYPQGAGLYVTAQSQLLQNQTARATALLPQGEQSNYIWFNNTINMAKPTVWAWSTSSSNLTGAPAWPGDAMVYDAERKLWRWDVPGDLPTTIIISDNGTKTDALNDMAFINHAVYNGAGATSAEPIVKPELYVYLRNIEELATPTAWAWDEDYNCTASGNWPGDALTYDATLHLWRWDLPAGKMPPSRIMFTERDDNETWKTSQKIFINHAVYVLNPTSTDTRNLYYDRFDDNLVIYADATGLDWEKVHVTYTGGKVAGTHEAMGQYSGTRAAGTWVYTLPADTKEVTFSNGTPARTSATFAAVHGQTYTLTGDNTTTAIDTLDADVEAPVLWYDLQGRRVASPGHGLYIRRQGTTAEKVLR